jgi:hypothetical protein
MGNRITSQRAGDDVGLKLSNGATEVLLAVLLLAGSDLAENDWERHLVVWLAEHDQGLFGRGCVGFDLDEIAWNADSFDAEKRFFLRVIDAAAARHRWTVLSYDPPYAGEYLSTLRAMIEALPPPPAGQCRLWELRFPIAIGDRCPEHDVLLHGEGCLLCNEGG